MSAQVRAPRAPSPRHRTEMVRRVMQVDPAFCGACDARGACWPDAAAHARQRWPDAAAVQCTRLLRHEPLYRAGDGFTGLFAVRRGSLKTCAQIRPGRSQVVGFFLQGSVLGMDGLHGQHHACDAIALEESEVCTFPLRLPGSDAAADALRAALWRGWLGREIAREREVMVRLGSLDAEERVAAFLLELLAAQGRPTDAMPELVLSMTREEIGSYLGLTIETVSRTLTRLAARNWISVCGRHVRLLSLADLRGLPGRDTPAHA